MSSSLIFKRFHRRPSPDAYEYFVPVDWIKTVPESEAVNEVGLFGNQNTVCRPKTRQWSDTIAVLKRAFDVA